MPCEKPLQAFRPLVGGQLVFQEPYDRQLFQPIELPCGQCILCRIEHARQWTVRITHEAQLHEEKCFITLTYDDKHLPPHNSLRKSDLQKFWKRLRRSLGKLRYYAIGEYGDKSLRPHYHACVFGNSFTQNRLILRQTPHLLWTSPVLQEAWPLGLVSVGALTPITAKYVTQYVTKKLNNDRKYVRVDETTGELIPLEQPKAFMSLKPPIAGAWLDKFGKYVFDHDHVVIEARPQKPPKSYDRWLELQDPSLYQSIKRNRKSKVLTSSPSAKRARASNARARISATRQTV